MPDRKTIKKGLTENKGRIAGVLCGMGISVILAVVTILIIRKTGLYPRGYDTMYHIYRGESLFQALKNQEWYPLYDRYLYNGVQPLRYWAPGSVYILAVLRMFCSSILDAYLLFLGVLIVISMGGWLRFGWHYNRMKLSIFMGAIWFFMPENLRVLFASGNMPRGLVAALLPWFMFEVMRFLEYAKVRKEEPQNQEVCKKQGHVFMAVGIQTALLVLAHSGQGSIVLLCLLIFLLIYGISQKQGKAAMQVIAAALCGYALTGIWLYPSLKGGLVSMGSDSAQVMKNSFQSAWTSIQPLLRFENSDVMYFGLSVLALAIMGTFLAFREQRAGFLTGIIIFLGTTLSAYKILMKLPFSSILWMERFVSVALIFVLISFLQWKRLKPQITVVICILLVADILPSLAFIWTPKEQWVEDAQQKIENDASRLLLDEAKSVTNQRIAVLDLSSYTAFVPYYLSGENPKVMCTFGAAWQSAHTAANVVMLNTAISQGYYDYLFDRSLELGNDTVYVLASAMKNGRRDMEVLKQAAERQGYEYVTDNGIDIIFHREITGNFGTTVEYEGIAIGSTAQDIALRYPVFQETTDSNLNHYSVEMLSAYKKIYLSGFTYDDREEAESLVKDLAKKGCQIYVDMGGIPAEKTGLSSFLGCKTAEVLLENYYPELTYQNHTYQTDWFSDENRQWNTVYLVNPEHSDGTTTYNNEKLCFSSTGENENIHLLGFNLVYYGISTQDAEAGDFLDTYFGMESGSTPKRSVVPLEITYSKSGIEVKSPQNNVNTGFAYLDSFAIEQDAKEENHLLIVNKGVTKIKFTYPYFKQGVLLSVVGMIGLIRVAMSISQKRPFTYRRKMV